MTTASLVMAWSWNDLYLLLLAIPLVLWIAGSGRRATADLRDFPTRFRE